jgi:hypothetical protein
LSRNKNRVGGPTAQPDAGPPPTVLQESTASSTFSFVVPTEFVELPSKGRFYPEGHPLCGEESIEIKQMTAKEEDMLTSATLLRKGVALDRVIRSLILDNRINPDTLLVGDRNAIILSTRVSGYGSDYHTKVTCPSCGVPSEYSFDLNEADIYTGADLTKRELVDNQDGTFDTVLPRTQITVTFKLLTGTDEKNLTNGAQADRKKSNYEKNITRQLTNLIVAVNGDDSAQAIQYLIDNIPSIDSRHIRTSYRTVAPNIDLTQHYACDECNYAADMEVPLSADFFWPDR